MRISVASRAVMSVWLVSACSPLPRVVDTPNQGGLAGCYLVSIGEWRRSDGTVEREGPEVPHGVRLTDDQLAGSVRGQRQYVLRVMPGVEEPFFDSAAWFVGADNLVHLRWTAPMFGLRAELKVQGREIQAKLEGVLTYWSDDSEGGTLQAGVGLRPEPCFGQP
jgi:hypothetical protein